MESGIGELHTASLSLKTFSACLNNKLSITPWALSFVQDTIDTIGLGLCNMTNTYHKSGIF